MIIKRLLLFLILICSPIYSCLKAQGVELATLDSIRVWLFSDKSISEIKLKSMSGELEITLDNKKQILDEQNLITIKNQGSKFVVTINNQKSIVNKIRVNSLSDSLINVITPEAGYKYYFGRLEFNSRTKLKPINTVSLEDYVSSVVGSEMNFTHPEALKVQAVISRTYALWNLGTSKKDWYDVTDHTMSQVYNGEAIQKPWYREAALTTKGEIALFDDKIILAVFSSTCGGITSNNESTWSGKALPYLRGHSDHEACKRSPHYEWQFSLSHAAWNKWLIQQNISTQGELTALSYTSDGRVKELGLKSSQLNKVWKANDFRLKMIKSFGPKSLKSTQFNILNQKDSISFIGKGMGHGIGVCQWGALGLAESNWTYKDILRFYYGGIEIKNVYLELEKTFLELAN